MDHETGDNLRPRDYLMDQESDQLVNIPDFHKMPLADVDVIERTLTTCRPRIITEVKRFKLMDHEPEKVTDNCPLESDELEIHNLIEEAVSVTEEEPEVQILRGLDNLLGRIEIMQCDIRLRQKLEGSSGSQTEDQVMMQREHADMDNCQGFPRHLAEIRQLQRAQHQMQCQITELLCRYAHLRTQKRSLSQQWDLVLKKTAEIRELSREYQKWMQDTTGEIAMCRKRSQQICAGKLTKQLANEVTETNIWSSFRYSQRYLLHNIVIRHMQDLNEELDELKRFSDELTVEIDKRLEWIVKKATKMGRLTRLSSEGTDANVTTDDQQQSMPKQSTDPNSATDQK